MTVFRQCLDNLSKETNKRPSDDKYLSDWLGFSLENRKRKLFDHVE